MSNEFGETALDDSMDDTGKAQWSATNLVMLLNVICNDRDRERVFSEQVLKIAFGFDPQEARKQPLSLEETKELRIKLEGARSLARALIEKGARVVR